MQSNQTYAYSPKALVASYERLKANEWFDSGTKPLTASNNNINSNNIDLTNTSNIEVDVDEENEEDLPMMTPPPVYGKFIVAAAQITGADLPNSDVAGYSYRAEKAIEIGVAAGAHIVLLPELFCGPYFCQSQDGALYQLADDIDDHCIIKRMQLLAKSYNVILPISVYERKNNVYYNTVVLIDSDGSIVGIYRKSHIPDGPGYQEKFYFTPGDTGIQVFATLAGIKIGIGICWDQWYPEVARTLTLQGADILLYPTAIGSEPSDSNISTADQWQRVMQGHSAANMIPVVASNRYGIEILLNEDDMNNDNTNTTNTNTVNQNNNNQNHRNHNIAEDSIYSEKQRIMFYGRSFITDNTGKIIAQCLDNDENQPVVIVTAEIDCIRNANQRASFGLFRDRRPDLYHTILTKDGKTIPK